MREEEEEEEEDANLNHQSANQIQKHLEIKKRKEIPSRVQFPSKEEMVKRINEGRGGRRGFLLEAEDFRGADMVGKGPFEVEEEGEEEPDYAGCKGAADVLFVENCDPGGRVGVRKEEESRERRYRTRNVKNEVVSRE